MLNFNKVAGSIVCNDLYPDDLSKYKTECREFISKNNKIFTNLKYLIVFACHNSQILFKPMTTISYTNIKYASVNLCHLIELNQQQMCLNLYTESVESSNNSKIHLQIKWLEENLMPKLIQWSLNVKTDDEYSCANATTLTLYADMVNDYVKLYQELKEIYWKRFETQWLDITGTSPEKFTNYSIFLIYLYSNL